MPIESLVAPKTTSSLQSVSYNATAAPRNAGMGVAYYVTASNESSMRLLCRNRHVLGLALPVPLLIKLAHCMNSSKFFSCSFFYILIFSQDALELALKELLSPILQVTPFPQKIELTRLVSARSSFKRDVHPPARTYLNERTCMH